MTKKTRPKEESQSKSWNALTELLHFALHNKKWWLTPIVVVLALIGILLVLGGSGVAPFIYTVF